MINIIARFAQKGVLHREKVKNDLNVVNRLLRLGLLRKVHRNRKVFYELTEKSVPLLEARRKAMLEELKILASIHKSPSVFHFLIGDIRFLDEKHKAAKQFRFLGDWQIKRPVVPAQLELAKLRFYKKLS